MSSRMSSLLKSSNRSTPPDIGSPLKARGSRVRCRFHETFRYVWMTHDFRRTGIRCRRIRTGRLTDFLYSAQFQPRGAPWAAFAEMLSTDKRHLCSAFFAAEVDRTVSCRGLGPEASQGRRTLLRAAASISEGSHRTWLIAANRAYLSRAVSIRPDDTKPMRAGLIFRATSRSRSQERACSSESGQQRCE